MDMKKRLFCAVLFLGGAASLAGNILYRLILVPRGIFWMFEWMEPALIWLSAGLLLWGVWAAVTPKKGKLIRYGIPAAVLLIGALFFPLKNRDRVLLDRSPDGEHLLILTREAETGETALQRPYRIFWKRNQAQLPGQVSGEIKRQWLENDICALTWEAAGGELRHHIAAYGDRGDGITWVDPRVPIRGSWTSVNPEDPGSADEGWTLESEGDAVTISGENQVWTYGPGDCEAYGTIALAFSTGGVPEWSLGYNRDCRINYDGLIAEGGTLTLCRISMGETETVTLYAAEEKEPWSETNPNLAELPDPEGESRNTVERMREYREQVPVSVPESEGMMGIFYVPAVGRDEWINVRNALKARQEMFRVNGVDVRVQIDSVRRLAGDDQDGLYEATFTSLAISPGNQGSSPEGESDQLTWRLRLMYADGGYLAAVFFWEEEGSWGLTEDPGETEVLSDQNEYHFFLSGQYDTTYMYVLRNSPEEAMEAVWQERLSQEYPDAKAGEFDGMPYMDLTGDGTLLLLYDGISEDLQDYRFQLVQEEAGGPSLYGVTELVEEYRTPIGKEGS